MFCASEEGTLLKKISWEYISRKSLSTTGLGDTLIQSDNIGLMSLGHESGMCGYSVIYLNWRGGAIYLSFANVLPIPILTGGSCCSRCRCNVSCTVLLSI